MTRLLMLVEGQSENFFVKRTLAPHLESHGVYVQSSVVWTKRLPGGGGFRGGVSGWNQILKSLRHLTHDGNAWVSTLLDFYGLPEDFPGLREARGVGAAHDRVATLEARFKAELKYQRFIPFLALHEFEAWLFSAPETVEAHFGQATLADKLRSAGAPELINHGVTTHPKARLRSLVSRYEETSDGPTLLEKIGIETVRKACPHFDGWLKRLEDLPRLGEGRGD
ncbi:hypothetical protein FACS1894116_02890 [Betaproteobacteria bacterium]|nr:hypothetical protein FACS1894116_02890 [Betaproteobacteria bacterium]GHU24584.1 hypothetical protein FACS189488_09560 [Betaproteobacteria bacterium]GHU28132.1 hypothetical protein FACS189497_02820 [Betaproteobacteria bacterium]